MMGTMKKIMLLAIFMVNLAGAQTLTLNDCISLAINRNPKVLASQEELSASIAEKYSVFTSLLPSAKASASYTRLNEAPYVELGSDMMPIPGAQPIRIEMGKAETQKIQLQIVQPVNLQLFTAYSLSSIGVLQKRLSLTKCLMDVSLDVEKAYFQLLQAKSFLKIARASKEQIDAHVNDLTNMFNQGILHKKDLLRAQVQAAEMELMVLQAENATNIARSALAMIIGFPQDTSFEIAESPEFVDYSISLDSAIALSHRNSVEMRMIDIGIDVSKKQARLAWEALLPSFAAVFMYGYDKPNRQLQNEWYNSWTAVGTLQWDLFNWGGNIANIRKYNSQKRQMEFLRKSVSDGVELSARACYKSMEEKKMRYKVAKLEVERAEENYRVTSDLFHAGAATNAELLDAHTDLLRAGINLNNILADYNIAYAEFEYLSGKLEQRINTIIARNKP